MATLQQIKDAVDARLVTLLGVVATKQATYAAAHGGHYWQGIRTHAVNPADGNTALPDVGTTAPVGNPSDPWPLAARTTAIEMACQIDVYRSTVGEGYSVTVWVDVLGVTYSRTKNVVGDEDYRTQGWHVVPVSPV
jgi:hypothetical protein